MKKVIFFALSVIILQFSCRKHANDFFPPPILAIHYVNNTGSDLFINSQNGYSTDSVRIYDFENGNTTLIYTPNAEYPYGYSFAYSNGESLLQVFGNSDVVNRYTNSIIHLRTGVDDTLKVHLTGSSLADSRYDSIWYNSHLESSATLITITK